MGTDDLSTETIFVFGDCFCFRYMMYISARINRINDSSNTAQIIQFPDFVFIIFGFILNITGGFVGLKVGVRDGVFVGDKVVLE
mmetsp:Transcript_87969/g.107759  ORF Transcript_87969/g.107759 Transcript_87969/m.107759 type:complete len:84 (-) Transcript_87969:192-443(-)